MLNIPSTIKDLFKIDSSRKNFRVHFPNGEYSDITNENVVTESVKFTESLCSQSVFKFGLAEASTLEFETVGIGNMYGMTIDASYEIDCTSLSDAQIQDIRDGTWEGTLIERNLFDEPSANWKVGYMINENGAEVSNSIYMYSQLFSPIEGNKAYTFGVTSLFSSSGALFVVFYDSTKTFIERVRVGYIDVVGTVSAEVTSPANAAFFRFMVRRSSVSGFFACDALEESLPLIAFGIPLGTFRVDKCPRNHGAMAHRQVTAYSAVTANKLTFPNYMFWSKILARPSAIIGAFESGLTLRNTYTPASAISWDNGSGRAGFNSTGKQISVRINEVDENSNTVRIYNSFTNYAACAYMREVLPGYNAEAYSNLGKKIAAALDAAGYDLTYNKSKKKVFSTNLEALMRWAPHFFTPSIKYYASYTNDGRYSIYDVSQPATPGELVPIVSSRFVISVGDTGWGFIVPPDKYRLDKLQSIGYFFRNDLTRSLRLTITDADAGTTIATIDIPPDDDPAGCVLTDPVIYTYTVADDPEEIDIESAGEEATQFYRTFSTDGGQTISKAIAQSLQTFPYEAFDPMDMANGVLELNAQFAKMDRVNGVEFIRLDNSSPESILPGDYEEVWWDEYDMDPIGRVTVTYQGDDNKSTAADITIGSGTSIYDMSDNEALKNLDSGSLSSITALINSDFAPYADDVEFTPVELTMQGWPWIEAGDALEVTAQDGTVVHTFALRIEMSGIQHLQATITAEGGEIIGEV